MSISAEFSTQQAKGRWHEIFDAGGAVREPYRGVLERMDRLKSNELRNLGERMEATLREMAVSFESGSGENWECDPLPQIFSRDEWDTISRGVRQRLQAFELFLQDLYGPREILHAQAIPIHPVLGSPHYQFAVVGLPKPRNYFLHLSGICLRRNRKGVIEVKHHHFSRASGLSYMMQNRRALARVMPELFEDAAVRSLAETPQMILEELRGIADRATGEPSVVMLTSGVDSAVYSEHSFLSRRMGIPLVQGGDLLVLDDCVYLKTVQGLKRVDVIYNRVADAWIDPLVFRSGSMLGVPGLVHCLRKGTVTLMNAIGSQLADDRSLLNFASQIIRFYLGQEPILPTVHTYWLGDIDQRELVMENFDDYHIRSIGGDDLSSLSERWSQRGDIRQEIRKEYSRYIAQRKGESSTTIAYHQGRKVEREQDHLVFALRTGSDFQIIPGALTRILHGDTQTWSSRDTWVIGSEDVSWSIPRRRSGSEKSLPSRQVTSRVAESFYWMGRYLERAYHQASLINVIEALETEELNSAERKLYRPMWNRLLPPLEKASGESRRSITNRLDRYRLMLAPEIGSVASTFKNAMRNAESVQDALSPEAWSTLNELHSRLQKTKYREQLDDHECARAARKLSEAVTRLIPQFFAIGGNTVLGDDGWRFCEIGEMLERGVITANSVVSISKSFMRETHGLEIELSAFLRLLVTRDVYRRVYQMRAEPIQVLELLWQNKQAPRSVTRCLRACAKLLAESAPHDSAGPQKALLSIEELLHEIAGTDWRIFLRETTEDDSPDATRVASANQAERLSQTLNKLLSKTLSIHTLITDCFLSHQANIAQAVQPSLKGF
ncbi:MAG: circularly permuted type 2 ATP-grasp protein [Chthoniobacteraceae bacterium]